MIARPRALYFWLAAITAAGFLSQCKAVPLTAPGDAELSMSANPTAIAVQGGSYTITVVGFKAADDGGGPLSDGTQIFFTTDLGVIEERVATVNGIARATLRSNGRSGTATVSASSGAGVTTEAVTVEIGSSGERTVNVTANPATLGPFDFTSEITATVTDNNGNPIPGASVIFSTDAGSLASAGSVLLTNVNGQAFDRLTLLDDQGLSATVTVTSGSTAGSVSVTRGAFNAPQIDSVFPSVGGRGAILNVTLTGQNFEPGATVSFGTGISVTQVTYVNSETLIVSIRIDSQAANGDRDVTVTNPDAQQDSFVAAFTVSGTAPVCAFTASSATGTSGGTGTVVDPILLNDTLASFNASGSFDPDGLITPYDWDFGDGPAGGSGVAVTHDYFTTTNAGDVLQVVLTVTDSDSETCSLVKFVQVP